MTRFRQFFWDEKFRVELIYSSESYKSIHLSNNNKANNSYGRRNLNKPVPNNKCILRTCLRGIKFPKVTAVKVNTCVWHLCPEKRLNLAEFYFQNVDSVQQIYNQIFTVRSTSSISYIFVIIVTIWCGSHAEGIFDRYFLNWKDEANVTINGERWK